MLRRTAVRAVMSRGKPMYEILMFAQPGKPELWAAQNEVLKQHDVLSLNAWLHMSDNAKQKLKEGLQPSVFDKIDEAIQVALGHEVKRELLVLYGSQSGTAEGYARKLGSTAESYGFSPRIMSMNDGAKYLQSASTKPKAVIFFTSTYGVGEFPTNSREFISALDANQMSEHMFEVPYAVFGLGNSKKEQFANAAKKLDSKLRAAGGKSVMRMHLSCELQPNGHDAAFRTWRKDLWTTLGGQHTQNGLSAAYQCPQLFDAKPDAHILHPLFFDATVHQNTVMTPKDYLPETRRIVFQLPMINQKEQLGGMLHGRRALISDWVEVYPYNSDALVDRALKRLHWKGESVVEIKPLSSAAPSGIDNKKISLRTLLREITDLSAIPSRSLLESLSIAAADATERTKLEDLANNHSSGCAYDKLAAGIFTVVDALEMFPSVHLSVEQLLTHAPRIQAHTFPLATDNSKGIHEEFEIVYNVKHREHNGKTHDGLCGGFLQQLRAGHRFKIMFRPSEVPVPPDTAPLVICAVGPGIGAARALLQHRANAKASGATVPRAKLFYGFRHTGKDQAFVSELEAHQKAGIVDVVYVPSNDTGKYQAVTDKFDAEVAQSLAGNGHFFYCGFGGSVPGSVEKALRRLGVDVSEINLQGRFHEAYFSVDHETEAQIAA